MFLAAPDANIQGFFPERGVARKSHFFDDFCARTKKKSVLCRNLMIP